MTESKKASTSQSATEAGAAAENPNPNESLVAAIERVARPSADSSWDLSTKRTVLVIMLIAIIFLIYISRSILPMILVAGILAYLLNPLVNLGERLRIPRAVSTLIIYILLIVALVLIPILFIPALVDQLRALANFDVPGNARSFLQWANDTIRGLPEEIVVLGYVLPIGQSIDQIQENSQNIQFIPSVNDVLSYIQQGLSATTTVVSSTYSIGVSVVGAFFSGFLAVLVTLFVSLYMTIDAPRIQSYIQSLFPASYRSELADLLRRIANVWQSFLRGQLILSITVGVTTWLALTLVGMPGALIFGILAGLLEVVPNLGPILAMIPAVITALLQGSDVMRDVGINNLGFALITVGIYFLIQQLENNILVPRIIGDSINLHPIIVICAVAVGLTTGGILGALLAPPVVATFRVVGSYVHAKLLDYPPFLGRPLPDNRPRTYRRKVTGRELEARRSHSEGDDQPATDAGAADSVPPPAADGDQASPRGAAGVAPVNGASADGVAVHEQQPAGTQTPV